jgi:hypothetical protein
VVSGDAAVNPVTDAKPDNPEILYGTIGGSVDFEGELRLTKSSKGFIIAIGTDFDRSAA